MEYRVICIYASEAERWQGRPLYEALTELLRQRRLAARCLVTRALAGYYEDGQVATERLEVLSHNLPLKIEIVLPAAQAEELLPELGTMLDQSIVGVSPFGSGDPQAQAPFAAPPLARV